MIETRMQYELAVENFQASIRRSAVNGGGARCILVPPNPEMEDGVQGLQSLLHAILVLSLSIYLKNSFPKRDKHHIKRK